MEHGVPEDRIIFINLVRVPFHGLETSRFQILVKVSSPQGLKTFATRYPSLKVVRHLLAACPALVLTAETSRSLGGSMRVLTSERTLCRGSETLANGGASTFGTVQDVTRTDILTYLQVLRVIHYVSRRTRVHRSTWLSKRTMIFFQIPSPGCGVRQGWRNTPGTRTLHGQLSRWYDFILWT